MRSLRKTAWRAWAMAVFGTLLGVAAAVAAARLVAARARVDATNELARAALDRERCVSAPSSWVHITTGGAFIFAYDGLTLRPHHDHAPAYAGPLAPRAGQVEVAARGLLGGPLGGAALVLRTQERGPCAVLQLTWPARVDREEALFVGVSVIVAALVTMGVLGIWTVVRPLLRSIHALSESARYVGDSERYRRPGALPAAELDTIAEALAASHARILSANSVIKSHMVALERHLAEVAHDFRTPLTALQLCIEEALDHDPSGGATAPLTASLQECLYLTALTENLRLVARRRETGAYGSELWVLDLRDVVERVNTRLGILARRKRMDFSSELTFEPVPVRAFPLAIERCVGNLVENAVVHGPAQGQVRVTLTVECGSFTLRVWNDATTDGPEGARTGSRSGSGLGLRISREVCAESGWRLELHSSEHVGTTATITGVAEPPDAV